MRLEEINFGSSHSYTHKPSGRRCYVAAPHTDDGAYLIIEFMDDDGELSGEFCGSGACELEPWRNLE